MEKALLVIVLSSLLTTSLSFGEVTNEQILNEIRADRRINEARFEAIDRRFEELREDMNKRFEAIDKRFDDLREDINRRFAFIQSLLIALITILIGSVIYSVIRDKRLSELSYTYANRYAERERYLKQIYKIVTRLANKFEDDKELKELVYELANL